MSGKGGGIGGFLDFRESPELESLAGDLIRRYEILEFINLEEILFLREMNSRPKALARCYRFGDHPIGFFTDKQYAIVFYENNCDYMTLEQRALLMYHEMRHIGKPFSRLNDHTTKDFKEILAVNLNWAERGAKVPDILKGKRSWAINK